MRLGVNVDHVATVRQARLGLVPDPVEAALACQRAGADSIVCHLREDRRHIQDGDVKRLLERLAIPLNLEMSIAEEIVAVALRLKPRQVTLVPERRRELTTEGGLDAVGLGGRLARVVRRCHDAGIGVSLFIAPDPAQIRRAVRLEVRMIELHTGVYAEARASTTRRQAAWRALRRAAQVGREAGLDVAAGHGLDYENVGPILEIGEIHELNIGFSIVARALMIGIESAVRQMRAVLDGSQRPSA